MTAGARLLRVVGGAERGGSARSRNGLELHLCKKGRGAGRVERSTSQFRRPSADVERKTQGALDRQKSRLHGAQLPSKEEVFAGLKDHRSVAWLHLHLTPGAAIDVGTCRTGQRRQQERVSPQRVAPGDSCCSFRSQVMTACADARACLGPRL